MPPVKLIMWALLITRVRMSCACRTCVSEFVYTSPLRCGRGMPPVMLIMWALWNAHTSSCGHDDNAITNDRPQGLRRSRLSLTPGRP